MSEEFDFERIKNKAIEQLKAGKPLFLIRSKSNSSLIKKLC